ncbi:MAG: PIN domain-containing protein [Terracidiphilus sp.]
MAPLRNRKARSRQLLTLAGAGERVIVERRTSEVTRIEAAPGRSPRTFLDTNILVYADDTSDPVKQKTAVALILHHMQQRSGVVSTQVLQEYFVAVKRKFKADSARAKEKVELYAAFEVARPDLSDILAAIDLHRLHGFSFWDALVLRMAKQAGCRVLLTEDMQHGQEFDGVKIVNPFL